LWSHYADKHRGICLGLEIPIVELNKIIYVPERFEYEPESKDYHKLLLTKYEAWNYEDELRKIIKIKKSDVS